MAFVCGTTNSDILNAADGVTTSGDHVYGGDGHDTICGLGTTKCDGAHRVLIRVNSQAA